jgi:uncharacterized protein
MYAMITGASSGIGKAMAFELAKKQINLILVARREAELKAIKKELEDQFHIDVVLKFTDISSVENCKTLHQETLQYSPEIVINNAGFGRVGLFSEIDLESELKMIDTNIVAVQTLTKLYVNSMQKGTILNVASIAGMLPTPLMATYSATKAYVLNFSRAVNFELKKNNRPIKVLTLNPGPVVTEFGQVANTKQKMQGMSAERCAKIAVKGLFKGKTVIVPGTMMKTMRFLLKIVPIGWVLPAAYRLQDKK